MTLGSDLNIDVMYALIFETLAVKMSANTCRRTAVVYFNVFNDLLALRFDPFYVTVFTISVF